MAEACDEILFDLKIMNSERAHSLLQMNQPRVLDNFSQLASRKMNLIPRVPLIPGYTMNTENFKQILNFLAPFSLAEIHLLPFHQYGESKYRLLGKTWPLAGVSAPSTLMFILIKRWLKLQDITSLSAVNAWRMLWTSTLLP